MNFLKLGKLGIKELTIKNVATNPEKTLYLMGKKM